MTAVDNAERGMEESFCLELTPRPKYDVGHKIFFYSRAVWVYLLYTLYFQYVI